MISAAENSNKFPKTRFWKEKSVEDVVTLGPTAQATLVANNKVNSILVQVGPIDNIVWLMFKKLKMHWMSGTWI